jgi:HEAT repeat protein
VIAALKDTDPDVREKAATALGTFDVTEAVEPLIVLLSDTQGYVRMAAVGTLCALAPASIDPLIQALAGTEPDLPQRAALALVSIGDAAVEPLIVALNGQNVAVRRGAARILGQVRDRRAIPGLIQALDDEDREVRREAIHALARVGLPTVKPLVSIFKEGGPVGRHSAMEALWMIGGPAVGPVIDLLGDPLPDVRKRAVILLGEIGERSAIDPLTRTLSDEEREVRKEAFEALEKIRQQQSTVRRENDPTIEKK